MPLFTFQTVCVVFSAWTGKWRLVAFLGGIQGMNMLYKPKIRALKAKFEEAINGSTLDELNLSDDTIDKMKLNLPIWLKYDEYERVHWLNKTVKDMWPFIREAVSKQVNQKVEALNLKLPRFVKIEVKKSSIGRVPFQVNGIKLINSEHGEVVMDVDVLWASDVHVHVAAKLFGFLPLPVEVQNLLLKLRFRVVIKDMHGDAFPCFNTMNFVLLEHPGFDGAVKILKLDLLGLPGAMTLLDSKVHQIITKKPNDILWPGKKIINLQQKPTLSKMSTRSLLSGQLNVMLGKGEGFVAYDLSMMGSSSDPYLEIFAGTADKIYAQARFELNKERSSLPHDKSSCKKNTLKPDWSDETLALCLPAPLQECVLHVRVMDKNEYLPYDNYMGSIFMPLSSLLVQDPDDPTKLKARKDTMQVYMPLTKEVPPLNPSYDGGKFDPAGRMQHWAPKDAGKHGKLAFGLTFSSFSDERSEDWQRSEGDKGLSSEKTIKLRGAVTTSTGVLFIRLIAAKGLKKMDFFTGKADPMVFFTVGHDRQMSKKKRNTRNPDWSRSGQGATFVFHQVNPDECPILNVEIFDWERIHSHRRMGGVEIAMETIIASKQKEETYELQDAQGSVKMEIIWKWNA